MAQFERKERENNPSVFRVLSYPPRHPYIQSLNYGPISIVDTPQVEYSRTPASYSDHLWLQENRKSFDIIHFQFSDGRLSEEKLEELIQFQKQVLKVPVVFTCHDLEPLYSNIINPNNRFEFVRRTEIKGKLADIVITLSPFAAGQLTTLLQRSIEVVPHGSVVPVDIELPSSTEVRRMLQLSQEDYLFLLIGEVRPNKDILTLAKAFTELRKNQPASLVVAGFLRQSLLMPQDKYNVANRQGLRMLQTSEHTIWRLNENPLEDFTLGLYAAATDAIILPYLWGTHSGQLELAEDVGVNVVVPDYPNYREQHPNAVFYRRHSREPGEAWKDLLGAMQEVIQKNPPPRRDRKANRDLITLKHATIYKQLIG